MNGTWGEADAEGNIPHTVSTDSTYTQTYTYTLPSTWRTKFIKLVPFVSQYDASFTNSEYNIVWNALSMPLNSATGIQEVSATKNENIVLYPNPARDFVTLGTHLITIPS